MVFQGVASQVKCCHDHVKVMIQACRTQHEQHQQQASGREAAESLQTTLTMTVEQGE